MAGDDTAVASMTSGQTMAIEVCTRTMSVLSLFGSAYIISTFVSFPFFRKPIHRLVFYATLGNILANVATLISISAFPKGQEKPNPLCRFQAVLIQWFMLADSLWVFCMATNVFLVFWRGYDAVQLRHLEKWYILFAYGLPGLMPIIYLTLDHSRRMHIIGPATLWCWVGRESSLLRLLFFYGPVWMAVATTFVIYAATGIKIIRKGAPLRNFVNESQQRSQNQETTVSRSATGKDILVTTEIRRDVYDHSVNSQRASHDAGDVVSVSSCPSTDNPSTAGPLEQPSTDTQKTQRQHNGRAKRGYKATVSATSQCGEPTPLPPNPSSIQARPQGSRIKRVKGNEAAMAYLKVSFLMFLALIVVWVPSSVNRGYQFFHENNPSFPLSLLSAIVLPTQGMWNAIIYVYTTRAEFRRGYAIIRSKLQGNNGSYNQRRGQGQRDNLMDSRDTINYNSDTRLEEGLKQGERLRHGSLFRPDSMVDDKPDRI